MKKQALNIGMVIFFVVSVALSVFTCQYILWLGLVGIVAGVIGIYVSIDLVVLHKQNEQAKQKLLVAIDEKEQFMLASGIPQSVVQFVCSTERATVNNF